MLLLWRGREGEGRGRKVKRVEYGYLSAGLVPLQSIYKKGIRLRHQVIHQSTPSIEIVVLCIRKSVIESMVRERGTDKERVHVENE